MSGVMRYKYVKHWGIAVAIVEADGRAHNFVLPETMSVWAIQKHLAELKEWLA